MIAQACHGSIACLQIFKSDPDTVKYLEDIKNMRKVVLELRNENNLLEYEKILEENSLKFYTWIEYPEIVKTCIAVKPYPKNEIKKIFKRLSPYN
ncbi:hypothetical protein HZS_6826 [Henneguya salminicola]|nr:hypothetical protein HZS_6826 [Henneguya salminicola]